MTGDWFGVRSQFLNKGIDLTLNYTSDVANNPRGGDAEKTAYADEWAFGASFDLQRLLDWNGAHVQITITDRDGHDLDKSAHLHTLMEVQDVYGRGETWRLTEFWFQQTWLDDRLLWKIGHLAVGENFGSFTCHFQNLAFCGSQPGNVRGDYWYNYPVSQRGARLEYAVNERVKLKVEAFQVNPTYINDSWAAHNGLLPDNPSGTTGALIPLELEWTPKFFKLSDSYKFGIWYDTSNSNDVYYDVNYQPVMQTNDAPLRRRGRGGAYVSFEQQISGETLKSAVHLFLNATQADHATSPLTDRHVSVGILYRGPFPARPNDIVGLGVGTTHVNSRVAAGQRLLDELNGRDVVPIQGSENEAEVFYGCTPLPFITLRPNLQYVDHPGGTSAYRDEIVVGLKTTVKF